jgi:hypothetical protein
VLHGWQYKSWLAALASLVCALIGGWDVLAQALVLLIALDVCRRSGASVLREAAQQQYHAQGSHSQVRILRGHCACRV